MVKIFIITRDSLLFILLASSTSYAFEVPTTPHNQTTLQQHHLEHQAWDVEKALLAKGLDEKVAKQKSQKLFSSSPLLAQKLSILASHKEFQLSQESILEQLTLYALFEKPCELDSYAGTLGFIQKFQPKLNATQIAAIQKLV